MSNHVYKLYWGILHCHVSGDICHKLEPYTKKDLKRLDQEIDKLYDFVINDRKLDFLVYADHHNMGNMIRMGYRDESPWKVVSDKADRYNQDGKFVALKGFEFQDGMEYNVYMRHAVKLPVADKWQELINQVKPGDDIILAAHNRPCPTDWEFDIHPNFRMIEIINDGGMFESWANKGLLKGHGGGFYAGSDDHSCTPAKNALTGVWATELTADAIWDAMLNRRLIATTNVRTALYFEVNGHPLGSQIKQADCPSRRFGISHQADTKPSLVMIIKNGKMLHQFIPNDNVFEYSYNDSGAGADTTDYYYAKVIYADGRTAFSSPIWIEHNGPREKKIKLPPQKTYPLLPKWENVADIGKKIGYHRFTNAYELGSPETEMSKRARDMVSHVGPDSLLITERQSIVYPAMDGIYERDPDGKTEKLRSLGGEEYFWLFTSLVEFGNSIIACGYNRGKHLIFSLKGKEPDSYIFGITPIRSFYYQLRLITPQYLATDGNFLYWLLERECFVTTFSGKCLGICQDSFPAFPCAIAAAAINRICILSCDRKLVCYDLSASQEGNVAWSVDIPESCCSLTIHDSEIWVYNDKISQLSITGCIPIFVFRLDSGDFEGIIKPDLINIRGTRIVFMKNGDFVAIHNPDHRASAIYRDSLNEKGVLRIFRKPRPNIWPDL